MLTALLPGWHPEPVWTLQEECAEVAMCLQGFTAQARMVRGRCRARAGDFWGAQEDYLSLDYTQVGAALHILINSVCLEHA